VKLTRGKTGVVRYIGPFKNMEEVVGVELDNDTSGGHDGKGLFEAEMGRGYFTRRGSIVELIAPPVCLIMSSCHHATASHTILFSAQKEDEQKALQTRRHKQILHYKRKLRKLEGFEVIANSGKSLSDKNKIELARKLEYERNIKELQVCNIKIA